MKVLIGDRQDWSVECKSVHDHNFLAFYLLLIVICIIVVLGRNRYQTFQLQFLLQLLIALGHAFFLQRRCFTMDHIMHSCWCGIILNLIVVSLWPDIFNFHSFMLVIQFQKKTYFSYMKLIEYLRSLVLSIIRCDMFMWTIQFIQISNWHHRCFKWCYILLQEVHGNYRILDPKHTISLSVMFHELEISQSLPSMSCDLHKYDTIKTHSQSTTNLKHTQQVGTTYTDMLVIICRCM